MYITWELSNSIITSAHFGRQFLNVFEGDRDCQCCHDHEAILRANSVFPRTAVHIGIDKLIKINRQAFFVWLCVCIVKPNVKKHVPNFWERRLFC